jgi:hypothetical protein
MERVCAQCQAVQAGLCKFEYLGNPVLSDDGRCKIMQIKVIKLYPWSESACEKYRPSDRRLSAKLVPTFADTGCHVVSVTDAY